jgi:hypothetical protein
MKYYVVFILIFIIFIYLHNSIIMNIYPNAFLFANLYNNNSNEICRKELKFFYKIH